MRLASSLMCGLLVCLLAAACSATVPPPRSPLAEPRGTALAAAATPMLPPTSVPGTPPPVRGDVPPPATEAEPAAARAMALLAEWIAMPARDLRVAVTEAVVWPSACLGIEQPGTVCAAVATPGFRVLLRDPLGGAHSVHSAPPSGNARWAGEVRVRAAISALDVGAGRVTLRTADGVTLVMRLAPGTAWVPAASQTATVGARVVAAYDPTGGAGTPVAAWIALDPA